MADYLLQISYSTAAWAAMIKRPDGGCLSAPAP
jgi:hypothetical protein